MARLSRNLAGMHIIFFHIPAQQHSPCTFVCVVAVKTIFISLGGNMLLHCGSLMTGEAELFLGNSQ